MSGHVVVYVTTPSKSEAQSIGAALVEKRLAACVNILPGMTSIFRWEGRIEDEKECVLLAKTRADLVTELTKLIKEMHSYQCPCVLALPVADGNADFLDWISDETAQNMSE